MSLTDPAVQSLFISIVLPLMLGLGGMLFTYVWNHLHVRLPQSVYDLVTQQAASAVAKAEQLATRTTNPIPLGQRKDSAVASITTILQEHHLDPKAYSALVDMAVEAAVYMLPKTGVMGGNASVPAAIAAQLSQDAPTTIVRTISTNATPTTVTLTPGVTVPLPGDAAVPSAV
jgi:hypothetical protein